MAAPGWWPDPMGRNELRFHDGEIWTDHVANGREVADDPMLAPEPTGDRAAPEVAADRPDGASPDALPPGRAPTGDDRCEPGPPTEPFVRGPVGWAAPVGRAAVAWSPPEPEGRDSSNGPTARVATASPVGGRGGRRGWAMAAVAVVVAAIGVPVGARLVGGPGSDAERTVPADGRLPGSDGGGAPVPVVSAPDVASLVPEGQEDGDVTSPDPPTGGATRPDAAASDTATTDTATTDPVATDPVATDTATTELAVSVDGTAVVGQAVDVAGSRVRVNDVVDDAIDRDVVLLGEGRTMSFVDIEACAGADGYAVDPGRWVAFLDDGRSAAVFPAGSDLATLRLAPGSCARGLVAFDVPVGRTIASVVVMDAFREQRGRWERAGGVRPSGALVGSARGAPLALGELVELTDGHTAVVRSVLDDSEPFDPRNAPAPGRWFARIEVEVCAGAAPLEADPDRWVAIGDASWTGTSTSAGDSFVAGVVPVGTCRAGTVEVDLPVGTRVASVILLDRDGAELAHWSAG